MRKSLDMNMTPEQKKKTLKTLSDIHTSLLTQLALEPATSKQSKASNIHKVEELLKTKEAEGEQLLSKINDLDRLISQKGEILQSLKSKSLKQSIQVTQSKAKTPNFDFLSFLNENTQTITS